MNLNGINRRLDDEEKRRRAKPAAADRVMIESDTGELREYVVLARNE